MLYTADDVYTVIIIYKSYLNNVEFGLNIFMTTYYWVAYFVVKLLQNNHLN